jgi:hypothetical protein
MLLTILVASRAEKMNREAVGTKAGVICERFFFRLMHCQIRRVHKSGVTATDKMLHFSKVHTIAFRTCFLARIAAI